MSDAGASGLRRFYVRAETRNSTAPSSNPTPTFQLDDGDADQRVMSITGEQFELGKRENHAVYMAENGELYLASAGADATDQRVATIADFNPKPGGGYILEIP